MLDGLKKNKGQRHTS